MTISSKIIGPDGLPVPALMRDKRAGLLVATIPAQHKHFMMEKFISTDGYENLDVDIAGGAFVIWNGTGGSDTGDDWTVSGSASGTETAASKHTGTNGLDTGVLDNKDKTIFTSGSLVDMSQHTFLSYWINAQDYPGDAENDIQWFNGNTKVGNKLHDFNYATIVVGSWVNVKIPIEDFNLSGQVNKLEFKWEKADNIHVWVDDIELLSSSGGVGTKSSTGIFRISGNLGEIVEVNKIRLIINTETSGWEAGDFTLINGGLDSGLLFRWWNRTIGYVRNDPALISANMFWVVKTNLDLFGFFDIETNVDFLDTGRLLVLSLDLSHAPIHLIGGQTFDIVVRDDLSEISSFRAVAIGSRRLESLQHYELEDDC